MLLRGASSTKWMSGKWPRGRCKRAQNQAAGMEPHPSPPLQPFPFSSLPPCLLPLTPPSRWAPSSPAACLCSEVPHLHLHPQAQDTLSSGSRLSVQSTSRVMHVVLTSGNVSRKVSSVVSPLACIGGFRMDEGKLGIQAVNSNWRWSREGLLGQRSLGQRPSGVYAGGD